MIALLALAAVSCSRQADPGPEEPKRSSSPPPPTASAPRAHAVIAPAPAPATPPPDTQTPDRLLQTGHTAEITALAFSPDRHWLATGSSDTTIRIWEVATGHQPLTLTGHTKTVTGLAFSPDGRRVASSGADGTLRVWDSASGASVYTLDFKSWVNAVTFTPDGRSLIASFQQGEEGGGANITVHDAASGQKLRTITVEWNNAIPLVTTADGRLISSGGAGEDGEYVSTKLWDLRSGRELKSFPIFAAISADGHWMASTDASHRSIITLWSVDSGRPVRTVLVPYGSVGRVAFSPDGRRLVVSKGSGSEMKVWATETGKEVATIPGEEAGLTAVAFSADGKLVAAGTYAGYSTKIWDLDTGHQVGTLAGQESITAIAFSADGHWLISGGNVAGSAVLRVWDVATGKDRLALPAGPLPLTSMALSADGHWLATNLKGIIKVWDTSSWTTPYVLPEDAHILWLGFGGAPPAVGDIVNSDVKWWPLAGEPETRTVWGCGHPAALSPDGKVLASVGPGGGDVRVWDTTSGDKLETLAAHKVGVLNLAFSPDGKWLLTAGQETPITGADLATVQRATKLWDVKTWRERRTFRFSGMSGGNAAFSLDGRWLAVTTASNIVQLFDVMQESPSRILASGESWMTGGVAFSPDGSWLAQSGQQGINLWKLRDPSK